MKKLKFKKVQINWKNFLNYIFLVVLSSVILLIFLIALPLTEKLTDIVAFDLNIADQIWSKEYILDFESDNQSDINKAKNIIFKRLNNYGVEEATVSQEDKTLKIAVKTTKSEVYVDELVKNPYIYKIVTRKDDVDFEDTENQYAIYFAENYNETAFDSIKFRNIYITELDNSSGEKSFFGLAKPWPTQTKAFNSFLQEYENQYVGVDIDGFVTPVYISDSAVFAIPLTSDSTSLDVVKLLYNSGSMPISYTLSEENIKETVALDINYVEITIAIFVSIILIYLYTYLVKILNKEAVLRSLFVTLFSLSLLLTYLKISSSPILLSILIVDAVLTILLTNALEQNKESRYLLSISAFIVGLVFYILGIGYLKIAGGQIIFISVLSFLSVIISNFYINKVSIYFKK